MEEQQNISLKRDAVKLDIHFGPSFGSFCFWSADLGMDGNGAFAKLCRNGAQT
jgi:hypothetical protein